MFDGHNGAIVLENGGGKTVFIQTALQAMLPHEELAGRKIKDTLLLENGPAHVAIEWILNDKPHRRYAVTCVSLFSSATGIDSYRYAYEYGEHDAHGLDHIPFIKEYMGKTRPADKGEMQEYYSLMAQRFPLKAQTFNSIKQYKGYLEEHFHIIASEWKAVAKINSTEGGIESFFDECKTTSQLFDRLLIPTVEEAMEGFEQEGFVDTFNLQRENFKKYKELKEQINENKLILQQLTGYVHLYEQLHLIEEQYKEVRSEAKALQKVALLQYKEQKAEQTQLIERLQQWKKQNEMLEIEMKSLELARMGHEQLQLNSTLIDFQEKLDERQLQLREAEKTFYSLGYAEHRLNLEVAESRLTQCIEQLARLEQSEDEVNLQEKWERSGGELRTIFAQDEQQSLASVKQFTSQLDHLKTEQNEIKQNLEQLGAEIRTWELRLQEKQTQLTSKKEQQQKIAHSILANPLLERVEDQMPTWSTRQQQLEDKGIEFKAHLKNMNEEQQTIGARQRQLQEEIRGLERDQSRLEHQQEQLQEQQRTLLSELSLLRPNWQRISSIYEKEASITQRLHEGILKRQDQKAITLQKERLAYRFVDDYNNQDIFFADAMIERWVHSSRRQFHLLQTGIEYIQGLNLNNKDDLVEKDYLWSVTLVTTEGEKKLLLQKLADEGREFAYPIRVLNTAEAALIIQGDTTYKIKDHWVVPMHWQGNEDEATFNEWKKERIERARQTQEEREHKEVELEKWRQTQQVFQQFLAKYPLTKSQELEQQIYACREKIIHYTQELKGSEERSVQLTEMMDKYRMELIENQDMIHQLGEWLKDGQRYVMLGGEQDKLNKEIVPITQQLTDLQRQLKMKQNTLKRAEGEQVSVQDVLQDAKIKLQLLRNDELFNVVQSFAYVNSNRSMIELKEEYRVLDQERIGVMKQRNHLEAEKNHQQANKLAATKAMNDLVREHADLDRQMTLPVELESHRQGIWQKVEQYRSEIVPLRKQLEKAQADVQKNEGRITLLNQKFTEQFPEEQPIKYDAELSVVEVNLQQEAVKLQQEQKELQRQYDVVERQLSELDRVLQLWERHILVHRLNDERIPSAHLDERLLLDFTYSRLEISERAIAKLQTHLQRVEKEQGLVHKGKDHFKNYCMTRIKDVKLRQTAMQGIELKQSYVEVMEFRQMMETRIQNAIHFMEETIQSSDQALQQFILRIHTHLKRIVQELRELPKKTRIKTAEGWKEIYSFSIPDWEDEDGKERIRSHIEWIVAQLEKNSSEDGHNEIEQSDLNKKLRKWLDSRQLLQVVLKNEAMKVTCRKVTNDHQVTRATYSWEQSNRWSGGEKWSKNMTLFLGLLNYVAEGRQYIKANMKLHRTVILDNPFGKASSDHVLSPVFFIAEQLGFQIIALTAHAEGKFLQDYFPIVYSCRLRSTMDTSKQIIESSKKVQYAYFRDHSPATLERIDSRVNQIELF